MKTHLEQEGRPSCQEEYECHACHKPQYVHLTIRICMSFPEMYIKPTKRSVVINYNKKWLDSSHKNSYYKSDEDHQRPLNSEKLKLTQSVLTLSKNLRCRPRQQDTPENLQATQCHRRSPAVSSEHVSQIWRTQETILI